MTLQFPVCHQLQFAVTALYRSTPVLCGAVYTAMSAQIADGGGSSMLAETQQKQVFLWIRVQRQYDL